MISDLSKQMDSLLRFQKLRSVKFPYSNLTCSSQKKKRRSSTAFKRKVIFLYKKTNALFMRI